MNVNRRLKHWLSGGVKTLIMVAAMAAASPALAAHFRGGSVAWQALDLDGDGIVNDVRITMKTAWISSRADTPSLEIAPAAPAETVFLNEVIYVGGSETEADSDYALRTTIWELRDVNVTTQYLARFSGAARISNLENNAEKNWDIQTLILLENGNQAPILEFPIIYEVPQLNADGSALTDWTFDVGALDPNADSVQYRLATPAELGDPASGTNADGLSIDANTGLMTWSGSGARTNGLYSAGIIAEDFDANGAIKSKSHVDFILDLKPGAAVEYDRPVNVSDSGNVIVKKGTTFSFSIQGSSVSSASLGDAQGALSEPTPDNYVFDAGALGTPVDPGVYPITFEIEDSTGTNSKSYYTINFVVPDPDAPVVDNIADDRAVFITAGTPVFVDAGQDAVVTDTNNINFDGGRLVLNLSNSDYSNETLAVNSVGTGVGEISVSGADVLFEGNVIGTIDNTLNGVNNLLEIDLSSANATPEAVQALVRQLTYVNSSVTEDRDLALYLEDPDGLSNFYSLFVQVPSPLQSQVLADPAVRPANGTATSTVTVQLHDSTGKKLAQSGGPVTMSTTAGTLGPVTDNGDGTYSATLTAPTAIATATISATINGSAISDTAEVNFVSPGNGANSTVSANPNSVSTDVGVSTITVQAVSSDGSPVTVGGDAVVISSTLGTVGTLTDNNDGTYSATLTSSTAGMATVSATINGDPASNTETVTFTPGAASGANSDLSVASNSLQTDETTTVTLQAVDANGNNLESGGDSVVFATTLGELTAPVTDNNDGTYTVTLSSTAVGTATVSATINGAAAGNSEDVVFTQAPANGANSVVDVANNAITTDDTTVVTLQAVDSNGSTIATGGDTVVFATTLGALSSPVVDKGDGTYEVTLSSTGTGTATVSATVNGAAAGNTQNVLFAAGAANGANSALSVAANTITTDDTTLVTVQTVDANGNNLTSGGDNVVFATTLGELTSPVVDNGNGTYTATLSSTVTGTATVSATVNGAAVGTTEDVQIAPGALDAASSLLSALSNSITTDDSTVITLQAADANGNNRDTGGDTVVFATSLGELTAPVVDNGDGTYAVTLSSTSTGTATVSATINGDPAGNTASVSVNPGAADEAVSTISAAPDALVADGVSTSNVTIQLLDNAGNNLTMGGDEVLVSTDRGTLSAVTDNGDGTYNATFTSPENLGQDGAVANLAVSVNGSAGGSADIDLQLNPDGDEDADGLSNAEEGTTEDSDGDGDLNYLDADDDNDGIATATEGSGDADDDGLANYLDADSDGDGIPDLVEMDSNNDLDAQPDYLDADSDNDGIPDSLESSSIPPLANSDADNDGIDDALDVDSTGGMDDNLNGIDDALEPIDSDGDMVPDYADADSDNDGIPDAIEAGNVPEPSGNDADMDGIDDALDADTTAGVDANNNGIDDAFEPADTDGDGLADHVDADSDGDGIPDAVEADSSGMDTDNDGIDDNYDADQTGGPDANADGVDDTVAPANTDGDARPDYLDLDSDNDTVLDVTEAGLTDTNGDGLADAGDTAGEPANNDGDALADYRDTDSDNDGFTDVFEAGNGDLDANGDGMIDDVTDTDGDGLMDVVDGNTDGHGNDADSDGDGTPDRMDTDDDNDGIPDAVETAHLPALTGEDADGDGIDDAIDVNQTGGVDQNGDGIDDSLDGDTDGDGIPDTAETDADGDGIPDLLEAGDNPSSPLDTDNDGTPDYRDTDSDNDGIADGQEDNNVPLLSGDDSDNDGIDDALDVDLSGGSDINQNGVDDNLEPSDADADGIPDYRDTDADNDSIPDILEGNGDSDGDGVTDAQDTDSDNDGIPDAIEAANVPELLGRDTDNDGVDDALDVDQTNGMDINNNGVDDALEPADTDGDGIPDAADADSDGDGIPDAVESPNPITLSGLDGDADGIDDFIDVDQTGGTDRNGNGIDDSTEPLDTDLDGVPNYIDTDSDSDGIIDAVEASVSGMDTDEDGIDDIYDVDQTGGEDLNNDGVDDAVTAANSDGDGAPDYLDLDSDNDGIKDVVEAGLADANDDGFADDGVTTANPRNADGDDAADYRDLDSDNDGESDVSQAGNADLDSNNDGRIDAVEDADNDGILDVIDTEIGRFGGNLDTDGDGVPDSRDLDDDNDGIPDSVEMGNIPEPSGIDSNGNGIDDAIDVDLTGGRDLNGDGIADSLSGDTDGDGIPDALDRDSDNDGLTDSIESGNTVAVDADGDGIVDDFLDADDDGLDDRLDLAALALDSDGDGEPNFRDLDSDGDGLSDLTESGLASSLDANGDGVLDGTLDQDGDGVADAVDSSIEGGDPVVRPVLVDTDGDGIEDFRDTDSDGDGFDDALEVGDFDGDGVPDSLQNDEGGLDTAVRGAGSVSLMFILALVLLVCMRKRLLFATRPSGLNSLVIFSWVAGLMTFSLVPQAQASADQCGVQFARPFQPLSEFQRCWYLGAGLGLSYLSPEGEINGWSTDEETSSGFDVHIGQYFKPHWFWELSYADAGEAGLGNRNPLLDNNVADAAVTYTIPSLAVGYYLWEKYQGWNLYAKAGLSFITTEATDERIGEEKQSSAQVALGVGAQYRFHRSAWFAQFQLDSFDRDAAFLSLRISRFFGGGRAARSTKTVTSEMGPAAPEPAAPIAAPAPMSEPAVMDTDGDGVRDIYDQCLDTKLATPVDQTGCNVIGGVLEGVVFESGSAVLTRAGIMALDEAFDTLRRYPNIQVEIQAHTDSQGSEAYNQALSDKRARSVLNYFVARGIDPPSRLSAKGYGERVPLRNNNTPDGRAANRRVELKLMN